MQKRESKERRKKERKEEKRERKEKKKQGKQIQGKKNEKNEKAQQAQQERPSLCGCRDATKKKRRKKWQKKCGIMSVRVSMTVSALVCEHPLYP